MASRPVNTKGAEASRPAGGCRVIHVDLRRTRIGRLAEQVRQGRYAVDARRLASDLLRREPELFSEADCLKP